MKENKRMDSIVRIENVVFNQLDTTPINKKFVSLINHYIEEYKAKWLERRAKKNAEWQAECLRKQEQQRREREQEIADEINASKNLKAAYDAIGITSDEVDNAEIDYTKLRRIK